MIVDHQVKFLVRLRAEQVWYIMYKAKIINMADRFQSPMGIRIWYRYTQSGQFLMKVKRAIQQSDSSRWVSYLYVNPNLKIHPATDSQIPLNVKEQYHITLTMMHLSSHNLQIETRRWSRIPPEQRICHCWTDIQTEEQ